MATELENGRPNIRIEIKNAEEPMEVDLEAEEGEILEKRQENCGLNANSKSVQTSIILKDFFHKGIEAFNDIDDKKLQERAKRFALKPEEINTFAETDLRNLYYSLGITVDNIGDVRFEAIHLRSSNPIDIENVLRYFMEFTPTLIEWVDDESCNVVWEDKLFTARTLYHTSQVVKGMPVRAATEHVIDSFILDETDSADKETSLINENRQIEIAHDTVEDLIKLNTEKSVDISEINIPIPPGYWRLGSKTINSSSVLLRFSLKTDKKPYRSEKCSRFLKNASVHKKREYKGIFSRNREIISNEESEKNPWGTLAKNWDEDIKFREKERYIDIPSEENNITPVTLSENPELRVRLAAKRRLGNKTEEIEEKLSSEKEQSEESEQENKRKTSKMPRMRMYADEEEEKIKRRKLLQTLKVQSDKLRKTEIPNSDLRNILRMTNKKSRASVVQPDQELDLSYNLKNRNRKLVFTVAQEGANNRIQNRLFRDHHAKTRISDRAVSPMEDKKPISPIRFQKRNSSPPERTKVREFHNNRERERRRTPTRRHERKSNSHKFRGRMYSSRGDSDDDYDDIQKPKSKVALVIKTQKKPTVASAIQSRSRKFDTSSSSSESSSEDSSSDSSEGSSSSSSESSDSNSDSEENHSVGRRTKKIPFKVEIENDQYKK